MSQVGRWRGRKPGETVTLDCATCGYEFKAKLVAKTKHGGGLYVQKRCNPCTWERRKTKHGLKNAATPAVPTAPAKQEGPADVTSLAADLSVETLLSVLRRKFLNLQAQLNAALTASSESTDAVNRVRAIEAILRARDPSAVLGRPELAPAILPPSKPEAHP